MYNIAIKTAYLGTHFHGFQVQPDLRTVQGEILYTLKYLKIIEDPSKARFSMAGRTDTGVHALGNVISFKTDKKIHINQINNHLPDDVQFIAKAKVKNDFKARYADKRTYRYLLFNENIDIAKLKEAADLFKGTHDFANFSKKNEKSTIREIKDIKITKNNEIIWVDIIGESFLWNMVRKIMRVLNDYTQNKISLEEIKKMINNEKKYNIKTFPAENLILLDVEYNDFNFNYDSYAYNRFIKILNKELEKHQREYDIKNNILKAFEYKIYLIENFKNK